MSIERALLFAIALTLVTGCASRPTAWTRTYAGPERPGTEVATLLHNFSNYRETLVIDHVSYPKTRQDPKTRFKLLPGKHHIGYTLRWYKKGFVHGGFEIDMAAGHTYVLSHKLHGWFSQYVIVTLEDSSTKEIVGQEVFEEPSWRMQ